MSAAHVETVQRGYDAWRAEGPDGVLDYLDPDEFEITPIREWADASSYHGRRGFLDYVEGMQEAFGNDFYWDVVELLDLDDHVVAHTVLHAYGRGSGLPVAIDAFVVWSFRGGKIVRCRAFLDRGDALAAAV
jgi:ketosteroid isomerase-like protein